MIVGGCLLLGIFATAAAYLTLKSRADQLQAIVTVHIERGQAELELAKSSLAEANLKRDGQLVAVARRHFVTSQAEFTTAGNIADTSRLVSTLELMPDIGDGVRVRHKSLDGIAALGVHVAKAGVGLSDLDSKLISPTSKGGAQAQTLLTVIHDATTGLVDVRIELELASKAGSSVDTSVLSGTQRSTFLKARATITTALGAIDSFSRLVPAIQEVLGGNGPRTYLIEQLNPAELRPGGGFIGTFSILRASDGVLSLVSSGDSDTISDPRATLGQPGYVAPPGPLRLLIGPLSWSFMDSNFAADFPTNAQAAETFAEKRLHMTIDGVIAIDYFTVAKILELTGGLQVPGYPLRLDATNFIPTIVNYDLDAYKYPSAAAVHKAILSALAGPLMLRLSGLPAAQWPSLISALNDLATTHHLQAFFNRQLVQDTMSQFRWSGVPQLADGREFMMEVESNLGGTKANYFVTRTYTVTLTRNGNVLHHQVAVLLVNQMPYKYHPNEFYRAYVRLFMSSDSSGRGDNLRPTPYPSFNPPAGTTQSDGWTLIQGYGSRKEVVFYYDTPWQPDDSGQQQIYWQKQPGTLADSVTVIWINSAGQSFRATGDLGQDRIVTLGSSGVTLTPGVQGQAQLPSLSLG